MGTSKCPQIVRIPEKTKKILAALTSAVSNSELKLKFNQMKINMKTILPIVLKVRENHGRRPDQ